MGAGSIVTKSIPTGWIVAGNPAKKIGEYADYEKKALTTYLSEDDKNKIKRNHEVRDGFKNMLGE